MIDLATPHSLEQLQKQVDHLQSIVAGLPANSHELSSEVLDLKAEVAALAETGFSNVPADTTATSNVSSALGPESVTTEKLAKEAVTSAKIALLSITTALLAAEAVTAAKIAKETITGEKIAKETIGAIKIAKGVLGEEQFAAAVNESLKASLWSGVGGVNEHLTALNEVNSRSENGRVGRLRGRYEVKVAEIVANTRLFTLENARPPAAVFLERHAAVNIALEITATGEVILKNGALKVGEQLYLDGLTWHLT